MVYFKYCWYNLLMVKKSQIQIDRQILDRVISWTGVVAVVAFLAVAVGLQWAHSFVYDQIDQQLSSQKISFPAADSDALKSLPDADRAEVSKYAGQQLRTGAQAKVFADNYIAVHLKKIGGGLTYSELSAKAMANPDDAALKGKVASVFQGEMLRGTLLNAYAFGTMATVALYASYAAIGFAAVLAILVYLGFRHARKS